MKAVFVDPAPHPIVTGVPGPEVKVQAGKLVVNAGVGAKFIVQVELDPTNAISPLVLVEVGCIVPFVQLVNVGCVVGTGRDIPCAGPFTTLVVS